MGPGVPEPYRHRMHGLHECALPGQTMLAFNVYYPRYEVTILTFHALEIICTLDTPFKCTLAPLVSSKVMHIPIGILGTSTSSVIGSC